MGNGHCGEKMRHQNELRQESLHSFILKVFFLTHWCSNYQTGGEQSSFYDKLSCGKVTNKTPLLKKGKQCQGVSSADVCFHSYSHPTHRARNLPVLWPLNSQNRTGSAGCRSANVQYLGCSETWVHGLWIRFPPITNRNVCWLKICLISEVGEGQENWGYELNI